MRTTPQVQPASSCVHAFLLKHSSPGHLILQTLHLLSSLPFILFCILTVPFNLQKVQQCLLSALQLSRCVSTPENTEGCGAEDTLHVTKDRHLPRVLLLSVFILARDSVSHFQSLKHLSPPLQGQTLHFVCFELAQDIFEHFKNT